MKLKVQKLAFCDCSYCRSKVPHRALIIGTIVIIGIVVALAPQIL